MSETKNIKNSEFNEFINPEEKLYDIEVDVDQNYLVKNKTSLGHLEISEEGLIKLNDEVEMLHPRRVQDNKIEKYPVCETHTGQYTCTKSNNNSELEDFGIGVITYFKTLKSYCIIFFILTIINIPLYVIYTQRHTNKKVDNYMDLFFKTTIGNVASKLYNCNSYPLSQIMNQNDTTRINLNCSTTIINSLDMVGVSGDSSTSENCGNFKSVRAGIEYSDSCVFNVSEIAEQCSDRNQPLCTINYDLKSVLNKNKENCNFDSKADIHIYAEYTCYEKYVDAGPWEIDRNILAYIAVYIDVASIFIVIISIIFIARSSNRSEVIYQQKTNQISDYTVHCSDLNLKMSNFNSEVSDLLSHIEKSMSKERPGLFNNSAYFYDLNYPVVSDQKLDIVKEKNEINEEIYKLRKNLEKDRISEKKKLKLMNQIDEKEKHFLKLTKELGTKSEITEVKDVWITYTRMKYANAVTDSYKKISKCGRCCLICLCHKHKIDHL